MASCLDKSMSESDLATMVQTDYTTPQRFVSTRQKRKRDDDLSVEFSKFKEEMRDLITSITRSQGEELKKITPTLTDIQKSNRNIESSIAFLSAQNEKYRKKIENLEVKAKDQKQHIALLEEKIEDMQTGMRKSNFEIKNVPRKNQESKEDLLDIALHLSKNIGSDLRREDIKDIYRVKSKKDGTHKTPIIVETSSTLIKNDIIKRTKAFNIKHKNKLSAKHLGFHTAEDTPVFVSENLTPKAARLHFLARDVVKSNAYKYCWTAYDGITDGFSPPPWATFPNKTGIPDYCFFPPLKGDCNIPRLNFPSLRYAFNPYKNMCERLQFSGCNGNANNFNSIEECKASCIDKPVPCCFEYRPFVYSTRHPTDWGVERRDLDPGVTEPGIV